MHHSFALIGVFLYESQNQRVTHFETVFLSLSIQPHHREVDSSCSGSSSVGGVVIKSWMLRFLIFSGLFGALFVSCISFFVFLGGTVHILLFSML